MEAVRPILAAVPLLILGACGHDSPYFGNVRPPSRQRLVYVDSYEPSSLDQR